MLKELRTKLKKNFGKVTLSVTTTGALLANTVVAHAEGTTSAGGGDVSGITTQITTALSDSKTQFVTALGAVVVVAVGFFIVKFVIKQIINYFAKVASKG